MSKPPPELPPGTSSTLRGLTETFSFHSSPESFITSRMLALQRENPQLIESRSIVRAKVLNRNVAVVSNHAQILQVLRDARDSYEAQGAYNELMAPFFPSPNLLLADGDGHARMRRIWVDRMRSLEGKGAEMVGEEVNEYFSSLASGPEVDIYEALKTLSWRLLLRAFVGLTPDLDLFKKVETLQEELLRGQFSLFPISVNTGFWHSPRKKGIAAKEALQQLFSEHFRRHPEACPFPQAATGAETLRDIANHAVLFTSSLAVKGLASLMTAFILNLFLYKDTEGSTLMEKLRAEKDPQTMSKMLRAILLETERLSPPIVGIMRRATQENVVASPGDQADILIPRGWDCWLYFVGGGRDPAAFGSTWDHFAWGRYLMADTPESFAFGAGPKTCLGQTWVRSMVLAVGEALVGSQIAISGEVHAPGVRGWLGWEKNDSVKPEQWAADMKQLPTQRPARPVMVRVSQKS